ncbi:MULTISPECIES: class I SAM-dependent methyltransferase [unclassified Methylophaga]|jgi:2-polyprenyl-3-methyl-5-hydroxy-6-metoxy-1,4-benzoquinol methylase|uniref:class I SAM-dependent methyltransferase n=1 Tax=unclassified Methylophaga TaxID=2629249 RepID=UPI000C92E458|nr:MULTISPECIES: class I SAM-dependent methyltransferase [unclassified Methylophaga]MAK65546.1 SAM-dependent methyltransferase [Methylophaga sp.]MAY16270.1 SAM-dependent methyltransferase [Methylophaga sp.]HAO24512.1 class I SAM-dependent methyltransferase [Methylophaga sp.]HCD06402.1 class I SAM-dependent methyltransferase [Methylophaga sp.]|tara:strand:+ start:17422 stop:18036 length:615 start_codon:yes stop_codon:yes gene_type:complete
MKPTQVADSYNQIADVWNSDNFNRDNGINQHERAIAFVKHRSNALDIGCGASGRIIDLLIRHGFAVEGLDISEKMLGFARQRHPKHTFYHADISKWKIPRQYSFISAWDSIWHLPLNQQQPVMTRLIDALTPGGVLIFTTGAMDKASEKTDSAMGPPMYYSVLGIPETLRVIDEAGAVCRHLEYDQYPELHLYLIVQKPEEALD